MAKYASMTLAAEVTDVCVKHQAPAQPAPYVRNMLELWLGL